MASDYLSLDARKRREGHFFQKLADGATVMVWMSGLDMGCFYFNRAWLDFRGRSLEQEAGNGWAEGVHPDDLNRCVRFYVDCFNQHSPFAMTYRLQNARGDYRRILDRGAPHYLEDGTFLGFYGGCADLENTGPDKRNAEIRSTLNAVVDFARELALEATEAARASPKVLHPSLQAFSSQIQRQQAREKQHAAEQMQKLASDMLTYNGIAPGEFLK